MALTVPMRMLTEARTSSCGKCCWTVRATKSEVVVTASSPTASSKWAMTEQMRLANDWARLWPA